MSALLVPIQITYNRVARGMLHNDQITFAILLARIFLKGQSSAPHFEDEFSVFLHGQDSASLLGSKDLQVVKGLSTEQCAGLTRLQKLLPAFANVVAGIGKESNFFAWMDSVSPEVIRSNTKVDILVLLICDGSMSDRLTEGIARNKI